jgi:pimeloyl-ACP methyl ester carboxylesterase
MAMPTPVPYHDGAGEPLVLLHGFTDSWRTWEPVLPALSRQHEVYAWSLPGHAGGEPWDRSVPLTVVAYVDAVERQLDAHGLSQVHLVGNSLGGWLSLKLAARGRALSVVGVCPACGWEPDGPEERSVHRYFSRQQRDLRRFRRLLPFVSRHPTLRRFALRDLVSDGRRVPASAALSMFEGALQCMVVDDILGAIGTGEHFDPGPIDCPVRILYGSKDRVLTWPHHYSRMQRSVPNAEWVRLDGLGHLPMWSAPEALASAILQHTRRSSGQPDVESTNSA